MEFRETQFDLRLERDPDRSEGIHVSNIIRAIAVKAGVLAKEYDNDAPDPVRTSLGIAWEEWVFRRHPEVLVHPGEYTLDGISMSPDGVSFDHSGRTRIHECKLTWKSSRRDISEEWMWMSQMKSYCKAAGTRLATLHVFWVNGDYRDSGPQYVLYGIEFTERELKENWELISRSRDMSAPEWKKVTIKAGKREKR